MERPRALSIAFGAAAATLIAGFGALNVFALAMPADPRLRGLYSYLSASIGDSILLPIVAFLLAYALSTTSSSAPTRLVGGIGATFGLVTGILVQVGWLTDPSPQLNWTLVAPGTFNAAGWYHAVFLCAESAFLAGAAASLVASAVIHRLPPTAGIAVGAAIVTLLGFAALLVVDNRDSANQANVATLVGLGAGAAFVVALVAVSITARRRRRRQRTPST
jgi:hypothetical protein